MKANELFWQLLQEDYKDYEIAIEYKHRGTYPNDDVDVYSYLKIKGIIVHNETKTITLTTED